MDPPASLPEDTKKRKASETLRNPKGKKPKITPFDSIEVHKYKTNNASKAVFLEEKDFLKNLPPKMQNARWKNDFSKLNSSAVASQTWKKYNSAFSKFNTFSEETKTLKTWPLSNEVINGFVTWCGSTQSLCHSTVKSYILALSKIQKMKGFGPIKYAKSLAENLNRGIRNMNKKKPRKYNTISFKKLKILRGKIYKSEHCILNKNCLWAVCCTAFFGSFRLGELLTKKNKIFDKTSDLTWKDISIGKKHCTYHLKNPKIFNPKGEKVSLFPFPKEKYCPLKAVSDFKNSLKNDNIFEKNLPVFRLSNGSNLTKNKLNSILHLIFPNEKISCKSFRSGIPSILADFPDLMNDKHVMGWGRWKSSSFLRYQIFDLKQKKWAFKKMSNILMQHKNL